MKKIFLMALVAVAAFAAGAAGPATGAQPDPVAAINSACPHVIGEGITLEQAVAENDSVMLVYSISDAMYDSLEPMKEILHDSMVAEMTTTREPGLKALVAYCRDGRLYIIQRMATPTKRRLDIHISPDDLD